MTTKDLLTDIGIGTPETLMPMPATTYEEDELAEMQAEIDEILGEAVTSEGVYHPEYGYVTEKDKEDWAVLEKISEEYDREWQQYCLENNVDAADNQAYIAFMDRTRKELHAAELDRLNAEADAIPESQKLINQANYDLMQDIFAEENDGMVYDPVARLTSPHKAKFNM